MADFTMTRLHEWMVILYAISLVFYFIDYLNKDKIAHRIAFWILIVVYTSCKQHSLIMYIVETKRFPILSLFEGIYFYAWLLIRCQFYSIYFQSRVIWYFSLMLLVLYL